MARHKQRPLTTFPSQIITLAFPLCLQCFEAVGWVAGRASASKKRVVGCWHGYLSERDADLHMAQLMPMPLTVSCFSKIKIGFTFLVPAHPGSPGQRAVKQVCVCHFHYSPLIFCLLQVNQN